MNEEDGPEDLSYLRRELFISYEDNPKIWEDVAFAFTRDHQMVDMMAYIMERETNAWLLFMLDKLPDWWRLVHAIKATGFSERKRGMTQKPKVEASLMWSDATEEDKYDLSHGWRVIRTSTGGRIHKVDRTVQHEDVLVVDVPQQPRALPTDMFATVIGDIKPTAMEPYVQHISTRLWVPTQTLLLV